MLNYRDKIDKGSGYDLQTTIKDRDFTLLENSIRSDSRDCIGTQSLLDAQNYAISIGIRGPASGSITNTTGVGVYPVVVSITATTNLQNGDTIIIKGVRGNTSINGRYVISNFTGTSFEIQGTTKSNYTGGGIWERPKDSSYPELPYGANTIVNNVMKFHLDKPIKSLRSISLEHVVIPRDIIPLTTYLSDFIDIVTTYTDTVYTGTQTLWTTSIKQEKEYTTSRILGFYSTPLDIFRSYVSTNFSIPDKVTPAPLTLWNPPSPQPVPYPYQTVPTYQSSNFFINGLPYYIILSGYGVYDLVDWTANTGFPVTDAVTTSIIRKIVLVLLCRKQSLNNVDYIDLILASDTTSNIDPTQAFGFGNFQRYIPGPGLGQYYQPGTSTTYTNGGLGSGPPNVVQLDSPIPFPNFTGNVWGPYSAPGDRFQKLGTLSTVQDLYLNGDLANLYGSPIILSDVPTEDLVTHPLYGLNFASLIEVNLGNISQTTNTNILNAMRIIPNGFGAVNIRANGAGTTYTNIYESAGGQGPSTLGTPSAWVNTNVYGGAGTFQYPIAQGPSGPNLTPATTDASDVGTGTDPSYRSSYYDIGANNGSFLTNISQYINYCAGELPDTDLIVFLEEGRRSERNQASRTFNSDAILDCPIRLNLGSTSGTLQYIESLQSLVGNSSGYWTKRYFNGKEELNTITLSFYTYDGSMIPLEKMLQFRNSSEFLQLFIRIISQANVNINNTPFANFLFDPLDPRLIGRLKRYFQFIFKIDSYEATPPGVIMPLANSYNNNTDDMYESYDTYNSQLGQVNNHKSSIKSLLNQRKNKYHN